jgi:hypothetical protein
MSAQFNGGNSLTLGSNPLTAGNPFTIGCWFKGTSGQWGAVFSQCSSSDDESYHLLAGFGDNVLYFQARDGGTTYTSTKSSWSDNVWTLAIGTSSGTANRQAYLGSSAGTADTNSLATHTALNRLCVGGRLNAGTLAIPCSMEVAEPFLYDVVLSGGNITALAAGDSPSIVDAGNLVFHETLLSGAGSLTNNASVTFDAGDHPTINLGGGAVFRRRFVCIGI